MNTRYFKSASAFRRWLATTGEHSPEQWIGFYKVDSGRGGITYAEELEEALCFGWIDGLRQSVDAVSYRIRFTPRRPKSIWSRVNIGHAERLKQAGKMTPAGLKAYAARDTARSGIYTYEQAAGTLSPEVRKTFQADKRAWDFFQSRPAGYQRTAIRWVRSAKKEETRQRRLAQLIEDSSQGRRLAPLARKD